VNCVLSAPEARRVYEMVLTMLHPVERVWLLTPGADAALVLDDDGWVGTVRFTPWCPEAPEFARLGEYSCPSCAMALLGGLPHPRPHPDTPDHWTATEVARGDWGWLCSHDGEVTRQQCEHDPAEIACAWVRVVGGLIDG
jgi:hypothetical protein